MPLDPGTSVALQKVGSALAKQVLTSVGRAIADFQAAKGERAVAALVSALADTAGMPPAEAAQRLDEILTSAKPGVRDAHEVLYETFRMFAFTRTEASWPHIARLTADYVEHKRGIDAYFRRVGWLLERCEEEDITVLRDFCATTREQMGQDQAMQVRWSVKLGPPRVMLLLGNGAPPRIADVEQRAGFDPGAGGDLLSLLKESRLARDAGASMGGRVAVEFDLREGYLLPLVDLLL